MSAQKDERVGQEKENKNIDVGSDKAEQIIEKKN